MQAIFTSYQGNYHLGVGALINSALRSGFLGEFHIFLREALPAWVDTLDRTGSMEFRVQDCSLYFHTTTRSRHFGYDKPFQALELLESLPHLDAIVYMDPDVVVLSPWSFFTEWLSHGIALVLDSNAPVVPINHPWRRTWRGLVNSELAPARVGREPWYANSGFFGLERRHLGFLQCWRRATEQFENADGDTSRFFLDQRWRAVTGDQDLLAAAIEAWDGPVSFIGPDGMGFNSHFWLLSHATESIKPWAQFCLAEAIKARPPKRTVGYYLNFANAPIPVISSRSLWWKNLDYKASRILGKLWCTPAA